MTLLAELSALADAAETEATRELTTILSNLEDGINLCENFRALRRFLIDLGITGCGVTRRLKAILAELHIPFETLEDCQKDTNTEEAQQTAEPDVPAIDWTALAEERYTALCVTAYNPTLCPEQPATTEEGETCPLPSGWQLASVETTDQLPDPNCPTDTQTGCDAEDEEQTGEEPPQCDIARDIAGTLWDLIPPPPEQFPPPQATTRRINEGEPRPLPEAGILLTPKTIADIAWKLQALQLHPTLRKCKNFVDDLDDIFLDLKKYIDGLPEGYISPYLLPFHPDLPRPITAVRAPTEIPIAYTDAATAARKRAASQRAYRRHITGA